MKSNKPKRKTLKVSGKRTPKQISNYNLYNLGVKSIESETVEDIYELRNNPHNIIVAQADINLFYRQNYNVDSQQLIKKEKYVMSLGVYQQLFYDNRCSTKILKPCNPKFLNIYRPYNGQDLTNKSILVWRQGGIGDLLFISPNLKFLKDEYPSCKIIFACGPQYQPMVREWKYIDEIIDLPFKVSMLGEEKSNYHVMFEGVIERTKIAEKENAYKLFTKWMGLNLDDSLLYPEQTPNELEVENCKKILEQWNIQDFIIIQMRSSSPIRTPRPSIWRKIIDILTSKGQNVVLTDGKYKSQDVDKFISSLSDKDKVFNFSRYSDDISKSVAMTSLSKFAIGVDSSLIHIAESLKVRSLGIYGPFPSSIRTSTYRYCETIDCEAKCSPCFKHGRNLCNNSWLNYVTCYDNLRIPEVIERVEKYV